MTSNPPSIPASTAAYYMPPASWPNYDHIVTGDNKPFDCIYDGFQMRLLTKVLYDSWPGPGDGRPFLATANCGLFYSFNEPPIVPDVMLSLDVQIQKLPQDRQRSYFVWELGKAPDAAIEIVSGTDGEELGQKLQIYEKIGIPYYIVWDPRFFLGETSLYCFIRQGRKYEKNGTWLPQIGLGVKEWQGAFETYNTTWLRWCDAQGVVLPTGAEQRAQEVRRADQEKQRAETEKQRAETEKQRAEKFAEKLRALGVDPDQP